MLSSAATTAETPRYPPGFLRCQFQVSEHIFAKLRVARQPRSRHIAIPSWSIYQRDIFATHLCERANKIKYAASAAGSEIYSDDRLRVQLFQCADMPGREIHYVDIVPHA